MGCCWNSSGSIRIISLVIPGSRSKGQRQSRSRILMCTAKGQPPLGRRHQQQRPAMGGMASKVKHLVFGKFSSQSLPGGGGGGSGECHRCCRCCCRRSSFAMRCHALLFVSLFKRQVDASAALAALPTLTAFSSRPKHLVIARVQCRLRCGELRGKLRGVQFVELVFRLHRTLHHRGALAVG